MVTTCRDWFFFSLARLLCVFTCESLSRKLSRVLYVEIGQGTAQSPIGSPLRDALPRHILGSINTSATKGYKVYPVAVLGEIWQILNWWQSFCRIAAANQ